MPVKSKDKTAIEHNYELLSILMQDEKAITDIQVLHLLNEIKKTLGNITIRTKAEQIFFSALKKTKKKLISIAPKLIKELMKKE